MKMHRTQISLPPVLFGWLKDEAERKGISIAELIRRILDREYEDQQKQ